MTPEEEIKTLRARIAELEKQHKENSQKYHEQLCAAGTRIIALEKDKARLISDLQYVVFYCDPKNAVKGSEVLIRIGNTLAALAAQTAPTKREERQ